MTSLYIKHRPTDWSEVLGQNTAVSKLKTKLEAGDLPNVVLLFGPSGVGKNTIARIVSRKLGIEPVESPVYVEMNCADCRSIDDVREIGSQMSLAGFGKHNRKVWVLDEVVQLPKVTQQAMLKMLEDTPKHVYFILCASDKSGLLPTLLGRCYPVELQLLNVSILLQIIDNVADAENGTVQLKVAKKIAEAAEGSARMALQLLEAVLTQEGEAAQLEALESTTAETMGYQLAQALIYNKGWPVVEKTIRDLAQDPEGVRRVILKYCETVVLGDSDAKMKIRALAIGSKFKFNYNECGKFGLLSDCWKACHGK